MKHPARVFISYSHDSGPHDQNVLDLANQLRREGIDAQLDRYVEAPPEGWPRWVGRQVESADFIICVCSPQYRISFEGHNDPQKGLGVNQEGFLIQQDLYDHGNRSERYLPVVFDRNDRGTIPGPLRAFQSYMLPDQYEQMYRRITRQPEVQAPALGHERPLPPTVRAPAVTPLPEKSAGFRGQSEIRAYLAPTQYPIERLAPHDGLYLSRLINPQQRTVHDLISTIWVTARGPLDYVLDSIRIYDYAWGPLGPNPVVTIAPDAEYRFTYAEGSDTVHALNPALAIGPATRNRASFTLGTAMEAGFYYVGELFIWVQYQTSDGSTGTLFLQDPPAEGRRLAKLIATEVEFPILYREQTNFGQLVITPEGLQRGLEPQHPPACRYIPVSLPGLPGAGPDRNRLLRARESCRQALRQREALNQVLTSGARREELADWLAQGSLVAADLLGGLADVESTAILLQEFHKTRADAALTGLCVRHVAVGDELLARVAGENKSIFAAEGKLGEILSALTLRPAGDWVDVLCCYQQHSMETVQNILAELEPELNPQDRTRMLAAPGGPLKGELFVRGTMNNWAALTEAKLVYQGDGLYSATLWLEPGSYEFKIGTADWWKGNFGGRHPGLRITAGEQIELFQDHLSHNLHLDMTRAAPGRYTFAVEAQNFARLALRITQEFGRRRGPGDTAGLAASADGAFHPL